MKYFAYGSNLCIENMKDRCPKAVPLNSLVINNHCLSFNYYADIKREADSILYGGLWDITKNCEKELDKYEGVLDGLYRKYVFMYKDEPILYYKMTKSQLLPPDSHYAKVIARGYEDFDLPFEALRVAIQHSFAFRRFL